MQLSGILGLELFGQPLWYSKSQGPKHNISSITGSCLVMDKTKLPFHKSCYIYGRALIVRKNII